MAMSDQNGHLEEERREPARNQAQSTANALFSLSQTERRLSHRARREAEEWAAKGHSQNHASLMLESFQLWRRAKFHLQHTRHWLA